MNTTSHEQHEEEQEILTSPEALAGPVTVPTTEEIQELIQADPIAALLSGVPHKLRALADQVLAELEKPSVRTDRSPREISLGLRGRRVSRDMSSQIKFLSGRFVKSNGAREVARRQRQIALGRLTPDKSE